MRPLTCEEMMSRMSALIDRELDVNEIPGVWRHLEDCAACASKCAQLLCLEGLVRPLSEARRNLWSQIERALPPQATSPPEILTLEEAAAFLRLSTEKLEAALADIPHIRIGEDVRFRRESLQEWMTAHERWAMASPLEPPVSGSRGRIVDLGSARRSRFGVK